MLNITVFKYWLLLTVKIICLVSNDEYEEDKIPYSNSEFTSFIRGNKVAVMTIVNDHDFELKEVSKRIKCLKVKKSPTLFQRNAESKQRIFGL